MVSMSVVCSTVSPLVIDNVSTVATMPVTRLLSPLSSTPLRLKHVVLIGWLAPMCVTCVHVEWSPVRPAAAPAHTPLPATGDDGEELLLLDQL